MMIITNYSSILFFLVIAIILIVFAILETILKMKKYEHLDSMRAAKLKLKPLKPRGEKPLIYVIKNHENFLWIGSSTNSKSQTVSIPYSPWDYIAVRREFIDFIETERDSNDIVVEFQVDTTLLTKEYCYDMHKSFSYTTNLIEDQIVVGSSLT